MTLPMTNAEMLTTRRVRTFMLDDQSLEAFTAIWESGKTKPNLIGVGVELPADAVACMACVAHTNNWHSPLTNVELYSETYEAIPADRSFPFGGYVRMAP